MDYDATEIPTAYDRARDHGPEVFDLAPSFAAYAEKLAVGADSVLASLSESEFAAGMQALRSHAARVDDQPVFEPIDVFVFR